ncbi:hypothetical protein QTO12_02310 [Vibrio owensii]|uniref:hypothetical protein n=1 Tax=Vibrio owensii TaxID=696485 RepID=UPI002F4287B7
MANPMNIDVAVDANTADTASAVFDWALKFYDKNPVITSTCVLLLCAVPITALLLLFFWSIRKENNRHVESKLRIQLQNAQANGLVE